MNQILKQIFTLLTVLTIFVSYILMQNYVPSNKQSAGVAIIEKNGKILLVSHAQENGSQAKWAFLTGNVLAGENLMDCLGRVLKEELDITAQIGNYVGTSSFYRNDQELELHAFMVHNYTGKISLSPEEKNFAWVTTKELSNYDLLESQLPFVKMLHK